MAKISNPITVHIGDSITAGGGDWSTALFGYPLRSINLAGNGYTVWQVESQAQEAIRYSPDVVCVMAGTNDILGDPHFNLESSIDSYNRLLESISASGSDCIVTLVPFVRLSTNDKNDLIEVFNNRLRTIATAHNMQTIDLNSIIAPNRVLQAEYTTDGVHLSTAAYAIWVNELQKKLKTIEGK